MMGRISPALISAPTANSFMHIAHVGAKAIPRETDDDVDPSWTMVLADVPAHSLSHGVVPEKHSAVEEFLKAPPFTHGQGDKPNRKSRQLPLRLLLSSEFQRNHRKFEGNRHQRFP
jgi:hypothetical protein